MKRILKDLQLVVGHHLVHIISAKQHTAIATAVEDVSIITFADIGSANSCSSGYIFHATRGIVNTI